MLLQVRLPAGKPSSFKTLKPNAVVNEKSCTEEFDVNAQQVEAIQNLATKIRCQRMEARTGNVMIDQFVPWYFSVAFAFIFTYQAGMPDMPAFRKTSATSTWRLSA